MISLYFEGLKKLIRKYDHLVSSITLEEKIYSEGKGFVQGKVYFIDESVLEFAEVKDIARHGKVKYRYHYMNKENSLLFRYDNARHFPSLYSFPHHKHTPLDVLPHTEPEFGDVLSEIEQIIISNRE